MKTVTKISLATTIMLALSLPVHANTVTEMLTDIVTSQLTELSSNIKQQAKTALEKTATELFFSSGDEQAAQHVAEQKNEESTDKTN
ncbi:hypothetical protein [Rheinheimera maricola]|uniref:Uncharacterized protein n=1 Tax=Rheinheimera maricola TaxID=2793282 RepID=A0ABS7X942_9GAMM|nr:hypothetical protein [Rheinheimera maricola]MBZ9612068.1 hypothetical protein [Rheinheimera maricola]